MPVLYNNTISVVNVENKAKQYEFRLEVILNSQNSITGTSNITINSYAKGIYGSYSLYKTPREILIQNGITRAEVAVGGIPLNSEIRIATWTGNVEHDTVGNYTLSVSRNYNPNATVSYLPKVNSDRFSVALPNIPRASTLEKVDANFIVEDGVNININKPASFYDVLEVYIWGDNEAYQKIATRESFQKGLFQFSTNEMEMIYQVTTRAKTMDFKFVLTTYSNSSKMTTIGNSSVVITKGNLKDENIRPVYTETQFTYKDINEKTLALTGNNQILIRNYSNIEVTLLEKAIARKHAYLKDASYEIRVTKENEFERKSINEADEFPVSKTFSNIYGKDLVVTVIDSRKNETICLKEMTILDYQNILFDKKNSKVVREADVEKKTLLTLKGTYYEFENANNGITKCICKYRIKGSSVDYIEEDITNAIQYANGIFELNNYVLGDLDVSNEYEIFIEIEDQLSNDSLKLDLNSAKPYLWHMKKKKIMGIGGKPNTSLKEGSLHLYGDIKVEGKYIDIYPVGSIYMSVSNTNPSTLFGGTWEQIKDCFLLSAGNTYTAGSVGGEAQVTLKVSEMPKHTHTQNPHGHPQHPDTWMNVDNPWVPKSGYYYAHSGNGVSNNYWTGSVTATNNNTGGDSPHNNMPPYLAVYVWKRVS